MRTSILITLALLPGCYFGATPGAKRVAWVANGVLGAGAIAVIADAAIHRDDNTNVSIGLTRGNDLAAGLTLLGCALAGGALNAIIPTQRRPERAGSRRDASFSTRAPRPPPAWQP